MDASLQICGGLNKNRERSVRPYSTACSMLTIETVKEVVTYVQS